MEGESAIFRNSVSELPILDDLRDFQLRGGVRADVEWIQESTAAKSVVAFRECSTSPTTASQYPMDN